VVLHGVIDGYPNGDPNELHPSNSPSNSGSHQFLNIDCRIGEKMRQSVDRFHPKQSEAELGKVQAVASDNRREDEH
jgi:hypothetical protein